MKRLLLSFLLLLIVVPAHAGMQSPRKGCAAGVASCSTTIASHEATGEDQNLFDDTTEGDVFTASSGAVICGVQVRVSVVAGTASLLTVRVRTSPDLSSGYVEGTLAVSSANDGQWVTIPLSSTITGSTAYYVGVKGNGSTYNNRITIVGADDNAYGAVTGWNMTANSGRINYRIMGQ